MISVISWMGYDNQVCIFVITWNWQLNKRLS